MVLELTGYQLYVIMIETCHRVTSRINNNKVIHFYFDNTSRPRNSRYINIPRTNIKKKKMCLKFQKLYLQ